MINVQRKIAEVHLFQSGLAVGLRIKDWFAQIPFVQERNQLKPQILNCLPGEPAVGDVPTRAKNCTKSSWVE
jgi:hypothetical protein